MLVISENFYNVFAPFQSFQILKAEAGDGAHILWDSVSKDACLDSSPLSRVWNTPTIQPVRCPSDP